MGRRRLDPFSSNARKGERIFNSFINSGLKLATGSSGRRRSASNGGCMLIVIIALLSLIFSCVDYEKKYEYRLHYFDYKNAIQINGATQKIPQIEFLVFNIDSIVIKVKNKKPIDIPIQSEYFRYLKVNKPKFVTFYNSTDNYTNFRFSFMTKEEVIYYSFYIDKTENLRIDKIENLTGEKFLLFERNNNIFIYPYDEEKRHHQREERKKIYEKRKQKEDYFFE